MFDIVSDTLYLGKTVSHYRAHIISYDLKIQLFPLLNSESVSISPVPR